MATRSAGDMVWTMVGIAGILCLAAAAWLGYEHLAAEEPEDQRAAARERFERLVAEGRAQFEAGDGKKAVEAFTEALGMTEPQRELAPLWHELGRAHELAGDEESAIRDHGQAVRLNPVYHEPYLALGRILERRGQPFPAWQSFSAGLALAPEPPPEDLKGKVQALKESAAAVRQEERERLRRELRANPGNAGALSGLVLGELLDVRPAEDAPPAEGIRQALLAAGRGFSDLAEMTAGQESGVEARPGSVVDRAGLGNLLLLAGEWERARAVFAKAVELSGADAAARLGAALAELTGSGDALAAVSAAREAGERLAANPLARLVHGAALLAADSPKPAEQVLFLALQRSPGLPEVYRLFGMAFTGPEDEAAKERARRGWRRLVE